jgi:N-acetyl sugar amidotransferase
MNAAPPAYRICTRCVMDTSDPEITFDAQGWCNHCRDAESSLAHLPRGTEAERQLAATVDEIKRRGRSKEYDCIVGLSGGVDSTYIAYRAQKLGLRCLAVHFDSGWNSELAVKNIELAVKILDIHLYTFVCNWDEMRDLQLSFFKASVRNCDIPQDHAIVAALYQAASKFGIQTILTGNNLASESILPVAWGYNYLDLHHLKAVQRIFGRKPLRDYPRQGFFHYYFYYPYICGIRSVRFLNLIDFNKQRAMETLQQELGWRYYGGKHYESVFTRYFQGSYLPVKFGYDKRRAHLSSVLMGGEITREAALEELRRNPYSESSLAREDHIFVAKKLGQTEAEFSRILAAPPRSHLDYPNRAWLFGLKNRCKQWLGLAVPRVR